MRSRSPSNRSALSDEDDLDIPKLGEVPVMPNPRLQNGAHYPPHAEDSDDEMEDRDDDGNIALLGSPHETRVREIKAPRTAWSEVKSIVFESAPTLLFATVGVLLTGELLDRVSHWKAMKSIDELIIIIPVILNLKGNLEMNLSARLSTAANVGDLDDPVSRRRIIFGNLSLLQVQATVVSFVAACVALLLAIIVPLLTPTSEAATAVNATMLYARSPRPHLPKGGRRISELAEFTMVASTAMSAASLSSILLGSFMCGFVLFCRRVGLDPDNIAPPVASCLGDLVTLSLLAFVSAILIVFVRTSLPFIVIVIVVLSAIACGFSTRRNPLVKHLLAQGWSPLFGAMIISSGTGLILDHFATRYQGFSLLAIACSALPGSVGAIFVSRLSTGLHAQALLPSSQHGGPLDGPSPRLVMLTLLFVAVPLEIGFLAVLQALGWLRVPILFALFSVILFCCAVTVSLVLARLLTNFLWAKKLDPDMYALPIHCALMDLVGQSLLVLCFEIISLLGAPLPKIPK